MGAKGHYREKSIALRELGDPTLILKSHHKPAGAVLVIGFCSFATALSHVLWIILIGELCCNLLKEKTASTY